MPRRFFVDFQCLSLKSESRFVFFITNFIKIFIIRMVRMTFNLMLTKKLYVRRHIFCFIMDDDYSRGWNNNRFYGGNLMKALEITFFALAIFLSSSVLAQSPDSFIVEDSNALPGDTVNIPIYMHNTQFSVAAFTMRIVLKDSSYTSFVGAGRGSDISGFEYFNAQLHQGSIRIAGIADLPGGSSPPPLGTGLHEMVTISVAIDESAPLGGFDSLLFMDDSLPPDRDNSISDSTGYISVVPTLMGGIISFDTQSGMYDDPAGLPVRTGLSQNYPNPFNAETTIYFMLADEGNNVKLDVYDVLGREVRSFFWGRLDPGDHYVVWDGKNNYGGNSASGIYFYRLFISGALKDYKRMTLLK